MWQMKTGRSVRKILGIAMAIQQLVLLENLKERLYYTNKFI